MSKAGLIVVAPIAVLTNRMDLRTASRNAALAFSKNTLLWVVRPRARSYDQPLRVIGIDD